MSIEIDLSGFQIFDIYGYGRIDLVGKYNNKTLADKLTDEWIPYVECHKCGKYDYCKFAQPVYENSTRMKDIKCGVSVAAIENFIKYSFDVLKSLDKENIQEYLDGLFYFYQFVYYTEFSIGTYMNKNFIESWGKHTPSIFGRAAHLRKYLDKMAYHLMNIESFRVQKGVIFVEGDTEKVFLNKLKESHNLWFIDKNIQVYDGKGNTRIKRIQMLLDDYLSRGYKIYIEGDADGTNHDNFKRFVNNGTINDNNQFVFNHDFETSIPGDLLYAALSIIIDMSKIKEDDFIQKLDSNNKSVKDLLINHYKIDIEPIKMKIAEKVASIMNNSHDWWNNEEFMNSELGKFIEFIQFME